MMSMTSSVERTKLDFKISVALATSDGSGEQQTIRDLAPVDGCAHALKNEFTEDKKCHNLMSWLK